MDIKSIIDFGKVGFPFMYKADNQKISYESVDKITNAKGTLLLIIDPQNDFMEDGALGVKGSSEDMKNLIRFIYNNIEKIENIKVSLDTHSHKQIFHQHWWQEDGKTVQPFTVIDSLDRYKPIYNKELSEAYVKALKKTNKSLVIWPDHCIAGTYGHLIEPELAKMLEYYNHASKGFVDYIIKGIERTSEMYGIIEPEYSPTYEINDLLIKELRRYNKIIIAGEAKSHCILETILQLNKYGFEKEIVLLEDCSSSIQGFEEVTEKRLEKLVTKGLLTVSNVHDVF